MSANEEKYIFIEPLFVVEKVTEVSIELDGSGYLATKMKSILKFLEG